MRVVRLEAFRDKVPYSVAIAAVERGFRALGRGEAALPDPMVLELREQQAEVHVKGAHLAGGRHIVLKVATGFYRNRARGLPSGDGMFLLLDADTGVPAVLLEEHGYLTDFRTAAAVALTLKYLAPKDTHEALLVGAGALARLTARAMLAQMPLARLTLWNRARERAEGLAKELGQAVETRIAPALESAVRDHRVIVTATASTTPLVMASWVGPGTHITSVGTGSPEKIELDPALLARADKLVADRVFQTERYGNLHHAIAAGLVTRDKVYAELGDLAAAGIGRSHAHTTCPATPQRTAERRWAAPTPEIAPVMVWVVLTGIPKWDATNSVIAPLVSAQKPPNGVSLVRRWPMVFTMRHPPDMVPSPMAAPQAMMTHVGTTPASVRCTADTGKSARTFCSAT